MSSNLKDLELELSIAEKFNFEKREIDNLKRQIEKEKNKNGESKQMSIAKKILLWVTSIILMASVSYVKGDNVREIKVSNIVKVQVKKPKVKKEEYPKPGKKKSIPVQKQQAEEIEYEWVESDKVEIAQND